MQKTLHGGSSRRWAYGPFWPASARCATADTPAEKPAEKPYITIDAAKIGEPISKYVYGQFIEHLGRCIYGGIWAEMLEDRKFFYAVGAKESPWKAIDGATVTMVRENAFVGQHTPRIALAGDQPRGIAQDGLGLVAGQDVSKAASGWPPTDAGAGPGQPRLGRRAERPPDSCHRQAGRKVYARRP